LVGSIGHRNRSPGRNPWNSAENCPKFLANQVFPALKFASRGDGPARLRLSAPRLLFLGQEELNIAASKRVRRNEEIDAREVRLIDSSGDQRGVMSFNDALEIARGESLDLVEVSPNVDPPVCRIMDFGKFLFEQNKKAQSAKRKQKQVQVKEIKFRPGTDEGDYQIKLRKLREFLEIGDKTKVTLRFRGREMAHKELGAQLLARVRDDLEELANVEQMPQLEGRQMVMVLAPKKK
jgi:translation initiation factor IF-3